MRFRSQIHSVPLSLPEMRFPHAARLGTIVRAAQGETFLSNSAVMSTPSSPPSIQSPGGKEPPSDRQHFAVFWEWCFRREAFRAGPQIALAMPLVGLEIFIWLFWPQRWHVNQGADVLRVLVGIAAVLIVGGGAVHVSRAFCWEVSPELRELVRLTGIGPITLLCCKSLPRWSTIGLSVLVLAPVLCFARTLGGVTPALVYSCGAALLMLAVLTAGIAMVAGVSATDSENASTTAVMGTLLLMLLYHLMFWFSALIVYLSYGQSTGRWGSIPSGSGWRMPYDFAWQSAPLIVLIRAGGSPDSLSLLSPSYWIHFLTALFGFRMASVVMINRFRSVRGPSAKDMEPTAAATKSGGSGRPRCSESPHFWKETQILAGGYRSQRFWGLMYLLLALFVLLAGLSGPHEAELSLTLAIIAEIVWPIIFSVRLDALISAEFREQTWQSLMLLPIDRRTLLWAKVKAVAWQQRTVLLPVGLAVAFGLPRAPLAVAATGVIAALAGMIMCQVSAVHYLTPRYWWAGPAQIAAIAVLIVTGVNLWIRVNPWISIFVTVALMVVVVVAIQSYLETKLEAWTE
jgi:hypothetical protein